MDYRKDAKRIDKTDSPGVRLSAVRPLRSRIRGSLWPLNLGLVMFLLFVFPMHLNFAQVAGGKSMRATQLEFDLTTSALLDVTQLNAMEAGLSLPANVPFGDASSKVIEAPHEFRAVVFTWEATPASAEGSEIRVRVSPDGFHFSEWIDLHSNSDTEDARIPSCLRSFEVEMRFVQFAVHLSRSGEASPLLRRITARFIDPGTVGLAETILPTVPYLEQTAPTKPSVISRTSWGCPDGQNSPSATAQYTTVTHLIVHHTETTNASNDWAGEVRAIWRYHTYDVPNGDGTYGWGDIGYNYLIDPNGRIYEGRAGGDNVIGSHFSCANSGTMGVALLGSFTSVSPTSAAQNSLKALLAWKAGQRGIDPLGTSYHSASRLNLYNISGHRDGNAMTVGCPKGTACPGDKLYALLPNIRTDVAALIDGNAKSDLTVLEPVTMSAASVARGSTVRINWTEQNSSTSASSPGHHIKICFATAAYGTTYQVAYGSVPGLNAGQTQGYFADATVPSSVPSGNYYVTVFVDSDQEVAESNENNNIGSSTPTKITVSGAGSPTPTATATATPTATVGATPFKAINPSPASNATGQSRNPTLSWSNGGGATSYRVYFGTDSSPDSGEDQGVQTATTFTPSTLNPGTKYYWRIDATNSAGPVSGDVWNFTTANSTPTATPTATATATPTATPNLALGDTSLSVGYSAGTGQTRVYNTGSGTMAWSATSSTTWLTVNTTGGSVTGGNYNTLTFSTQQNNLGSARVGAITVSAPGAGGSPQTLTVTQSANPNPPPPSVQIPNGAVIGLMANVNGLYVTAESNGSSALIANRPGLGAWEQFQIIDLGDGTIALRSLTNGKFVCADNGGSTALIANRSAIGTWERFQLENMGGGNFAIVAQANGKYVCAENGGKSSLIANRTMAGAWEQFRMAFLPSVKPFNVTASFQAAVTGGYVSAANAGAASLVANRPTEGGSEQFQIHDVGNGNVAIRSLINGRYVTAENYGMDPLIANREGIGGWEQFQLVDTGGGTVALRALVNGLYVSSGNAGDQLVANRSYVGGTEQFLLNISLRAAVNNAFVCAENYGKDPLIANRPSIGVWEQFQVVNAGTGYFGLKAKVNGMYVCAENYGKEPLIANRPSIGAWEQFQWIVAGNGNVVLKAAINGQFVCAENGGNGALIANRPSASTWEQFR